MVERIVTMRPTAHLALVSPSGAVTGSLCGAVGRTTRGGAWAYARRMGHACPECERIALAALAGMSANPMEGSAPQRDGLGRFMACPHA